MVSEPYFHLACDVATVTLPVSWALVRIRWGASEKSPEAHRAGAQPSSTDGDPETLGSLVASGTLSPRPRGTAELAGVGVLTRTLCHTLGKTQPSPAEAL